MARSRQTIAVAFVALCLASIAFAAATPPRSSERDDLTQQQQHSGVGQGGGGLAAIGAQIVEDVSRKLDASMEALRHAPEGLYGVVAFTRNLLQQEPTPTPLGPRSRWTSSGKTSAAASLQSPSIELARAVHEMRQAQQQQQPTQVKAGGKARVATGGRRLSPDERYMMQYKQHVEQVPQAYLNALNSMVAEAAVPADAAAAVPGRALATEECNRGLAVTSVETQYYCSGVQVSEAVYNAALAASAQQANSTVNVTNSANVTGNSSSIPDGAPIIPFFSNCTTTEETQLVCACPLDYMGAACGDRRPSTCRTVVADSEYQACVSSPTTTYAGYDPADIGDPPCLFLDSDTTLDLRLECSFNDPPTPMCNGTAIAADVIAAGGSAPYYGLEGCMEARLQYWVRKPDDSFAMSETRPMAIRAKPYDFARLSDDSAAVEASVTAAMMVGTETASLPLTTASTLEARFTPGGRVYIEAQLQNSPNQLSVPAARIVADLKGYTEPSVGNEATNAVLLAIVFVLLAILIGIAVVYWFYLRPSTPSAAPPTSTGAGAGVEFTEMSKLKEG